MFHVSPRVYGGIFALLSVGFIGGNQLNIWLSRRHEDRRLYRIALYAQTAVALCFLAGALGSAGLIATIVLLLLYLSCVGITYPNAAAIAMAPFSRNAGSASALLGFLQLSIGAVVSAGVGLLNAKDSAPIVALMTSTTLIGLGVFLVGRNRVGRQRHRMT
jgi:MFS transporter, DHA1 family, multidrug resistance protein